MNAGICVQDFCSALLVSVEHRLWNSVPFAIDGGVAADLDPLSISALEELDLYGVEARG